MTSPTIDFLLTRAEALMVRARDPSTRFSSREFCTLMQEYDAIAEMLRTAKRYEEKSGTVQTWWEYYCLKHALPELHGASMLGFLS